MAEEQKRIHQHRLKRDYQFPSAVRTMTDGNLFAWIVPNIHNNPYSKENPIVYAVIRYWIYGDTRCWIESQSHFDTDVSKAESWIKEQFETLKEEGIS